VGIQGRKSLHNFNLFERACLYMVECLYLIPKKPAKRQLLQKRNATIRQQYKDGQTIIELAQRHKLSSQRVFQIVNNRNH